MQLRLRLGLFALAVGLLSAAYTALLWPHMTSGSALVLGFVASVFLLLLPGSVMGLISGFRRRRLLRNAGPPREDGDAACSGRIEPLAEATTAPLSGEPAVLWQYQFDARLSGAEAGRGSWMGFGHVAMVIDTGAGRVPIACGVLPKDLPRQSLTDEDAIVRARKLIDRPSRRSVEGGLGMARLFGDLERLLADEDGDTRLDYYRGPKIEGQANVDELRRLEERRLDPGRLVTVIGEYSLAQRAFVASSKGLEMHLLSTDALERAALQGKVGMVAFALLANVVFQSLVAVIVLRGG
ncbi:MAG: hypothetical protein AAGA81_12895 [Acidobacteriota bacterium]